jgi:AbrB family looped-hinge helix DNA binding protein
MSVTTVSPKGAVVIPVELRKKFGISPGNKVTVIEVDGRLQLFPLPQDPVKSLRGCLKSEKTVKEILDQGRKEDKLHDEFLRNKFGRSNRQ